MKSIFVAVLLLGSSIATQAQTVLPAAPPASLGAEGTRPWQVEFSVMNGYDGNIGHDVTPIRSYGVAPGASLGYENNTLAWGYNVALNSYTGTDEWDRVSHGLYAVSSRRLGRLRLETGGAATWKGSSEDRELANEFGVSERVVFKATGSTRLVGGAAFRYKQYPDDPETSGPSPYVVAKLDHRFGDQRVTLGYKYQVRHSRAPRDRYHRHAYSATFSMPLDLPGDELSFEVEYRPQVYDQRLIRVGNTREPRRDRRWQLAASYARPLSGRISVVWVAGYETRDSNDADKLYSAPSFGMTLRYRWW